VQIRDRSTVRPRSDRGHAPNPHAAAIIAVCAKLVLRVRPLPILQALLISTVGNLLAKLSDVVLDWPSVISFLIPGVVNPVLAYGLFKPTLPRLMADWIAGFLLYFVVHVVLMQLFGLTFLFSAWTPQLSSQGAGHSLHCGRVTSACS
jgi:hypothetical protein